LPLLAFPGVPIFFFISGLLISRSYERTSALRDYARNRVLRIFPALHVCVALNLLAIALTGYFATVGAGFLDVAILYLAKTSILQFYNPDFMRPFGDGVLNGSLWTVCVELQFYVLTPIVYRLFVSADRRRSDRRLFVLLLASLAFNRVLHAIDPAGQGTVVWPWIYMFLAGTLVQRNFERLAGWIRAPVCAAVLLAYPVYALTLHHFGQMLDNSLGPHVFFPLAAAVLAAAYFPAPALRRVLGGNDISYGVYIYHVPVSNTFLFYGLTGSPLFTLLALGLALLLAAASWVWVERPCLLRKRDAARPLPMAAAG
jgi:peptidoglycan/LPS O-acetylase OafA/YrhL